MNCGQKPMARLGIFEVIVSGTFFFFFLVVVKLEVLKEVDMYKWVVVCLLNLIGNGFLGLNFRAELGLLI